jgi:hypothetical protein
VYGFTVAIFGTLDDEERRDDLEQRRDDHRERDQHGERRRQALPLAVPVAVVLGLGGSAASRHARRHLDLDLGVLGRARSARS